MVHNPWPERPPGRPRRTDDFVHMDFRISDSQRAIALELSKRPGWPHRDAQQVIRRIIDRELMRYGEQLMAEGWKPPDGGAA